MRVGPLSTPGKMSLQSIVKCESDVRHLVIPSLHKLSDAKSLMKVWKVTGKAVSMIFLLK